MKVILAKSAGFCWGVQRAVSKVRELANKNSDTIYTDGPLIHNRQMMAELYKEGILESNNPQNISKGVLVVRAHGIPPSRRTMLKNLSAQIVDATCPDVARIQGIIKKYTRNKFHIIIFGDQGHAEVIGLLGYTNGKGHVIDQPEDIKKLPEMHPVCMVSQSTQFPDSYKKIAETLLLRFPDSKIIDTICESTKNRQKELIKISTLVDAIIVVGGIHSANTARLVELAKTLKPTFHIQTSKQINPDQLKRFCVLGLTAGASTPEFIINDVKEKLKAIIPDI